MERLNEYITFLKASDNPLSANVFFIEADKETFIYDTGSSIEAFNEIEKIKNRKTIIISHFHQDHTENLKRITYDKLYIGDKTSKYFPQGMIIRQETIIREKPQIELLPIISTHCKGSLILNFNNTYLFVGDSLYSASIKGQDAYNSQLLKETITTIKNINTQYIISSHDEKMIYSKEEQIKELENYYNKREKNNPYIFI